MALGYVRYLVGYDAGKLRLALRGQYEPGIDSDETAWHRKRIDLRIDDQEKIKLLARIGTCGDQLIAQVVEVIGDFRVVGIAGVRPDFPHHVFAEPALH